MLSLPPAPFCVAYVPENSETPRFVNVRLCDVEVLPICSLPMPESPPMSSFFSPEPPESCFAKSSPPLTFKTPDTLKDDVDDPDR